MPTPVHTEVIIQARMSSTRLPGKILAPFAGKLSVLEWIVERARAAKHVDRVVVATTVNPLDDATEKVCERISCPCVRGSEDNVLARFADAIKGYPATVIIHWTADNPLVDTAEMSRLVEILGSEHLDYANNHKDGLPIGAGTEAFTSKAFERVVREADTPYDREHVTPYFYHHPEFFTSRFVAPLTIHSFAQKVRLTLDSSEDLQCLHALAAGLGLSDPALQPSTHEILSFLEAHPEIVRMNDHIVQKTRPYAA